MGRRQVENRLAGIAGNIVLIFGDTTARSLVQADFEAFSWGRGASAVHFCSPHVQCMLVVMWACYAPHTHTHTRFQKMNSKMSEVDVCGSLVDAAIPLS